MTAPTVPLCVIAIEDPEPLLAIETAFWSSDVFRLETERSGELVLPDARFLEMDNAAPLVKVCMSARVFPEKLLLASIVVVPPISSKEVLIGRVPSSIISLMRFCLAEVIRSVGATSSNWLAILTPVHQPLHPESSFHQELGCFWLLFQAR